MVVRTVVQVAQYYIASGQTFSYKQAGTVPLLYCLPFLPPRTPYFAEMVENVSISLFKYTVFVALIR